MAGDWLKIEKITPDKPEIEAIATLLDLDPDAVFGKCFRVWRWFDDHAMTEPQPGSVWTASNGETRTVIECFDRRCGRAIAYTVNDSEDWCYVEDWQKWVTEHNVMQR